jgi:DNA-3-methyladenine glycosylase II
MVTSSRGGQAGAGRAAWLQKAQAYLRNADPVLAAKLIADRPDFDSRRWMTELPPMDLFGALLFQIVGQQLSVAATRRTLARIEARFGGRLPSAADVLGTDPAQFRDAGLSWRKISTLRELAERLSDGRLDPDVLAGLPDDELISLLTEIPGIGPWTAQGALIIALGREDVVLPGDLALRKAVPRDLPPRSPAHGGRGPGDRREMAALPQSGDRLPVLGRIRGSSGTRRPSGTSRWDAA